MDDLISRQELLKRTIYNPLHVLYISSQDVLDCPSAQQWIPCSERLPDQNGKYLVVGRQKAINILKFDGGRWYGKWGVVAWMPLPEIYKGENDG